MAALQEVSHVKMLYAFLISPTQALCPTQYDLADLMPLIQDVSYI
jgi:hypothetical protein